MSSPKKRSRILDEMHETARDLHAAGIIDDKKMKHFDLLCHQDVPAYSKSQIRALRKRHEMSQALFATVLNTSLSTVRQWEIGVKKPSGPSLKLLQVLDRKGLDALM